jgi:hypothetical protein
VKDKEAAAAEAAKTGVWVQQSMADEAKKWW